MRIPESAILISVNNERKFRVFRVAYFRCVRPLRRSLFRISNSPNTHEFPFRPKKFLQTIGKHLRQGDVPDLNILVAPLVEQLDAAHLREGILGQHGEGRSRVLDLDFPVVRHYGHLLSRGRVS